MEKFLVQGKRKLSGDFLPVGNKNEALPILAAILLSDQEIVLENLPDIGDVRVMQELLLRLGVSIHILEDRKVAFQAKNIHSALPDFELSQKIRGSFLLVAPLLHRFQKVQMPSPGGDFIGRRRLDTHFLALEKMGVEIEAYHNCYTFSCKKFNPADIFLDEASVMATETLPSLRPERAAKRKKAMRLYTAWDWCAHPPIPM